MFKNSMFHRLACILFAATIVVSGCGKAVPAGSVGVILPDKTIPIWNQVETGFNTAFKAAETNDSILYTKNSSGLEGYVLVDSNGNPVSLPSYSDVELSYVQNLIAQGVKVIIINSFIDADPAREAELARKAGVKVIALDHIIVGTDAVDYYVAFDPAAVGKLEAQYLVDRATGSSNPLYLYSINPSSDYYTHLLLAGAWSVLQPKIADGTFVIRNSSEAASLQNKPVLTWDEWIRIMEQIGATHLDASGKYLTYDTTLGSADLAKATAADKAKLFVLAVDDFTAQIVGFTLAADPDVKTFILTGSGAEKSAIQNIIDGKQSMSVLSDERRLTGDAVAIAEDYLQGKTPPQAATYKNGTIDVPATLSGALTVVDLGNIQSALIDSGYYAAGDFKGLP